MHPLLHFMIECCFESELSLDYIVLNNFGKHNVLCHINKDRFSRRPIGKARMIPLSPWIDQDETNYHNSSLHKFYGRNAEMVHPYRNQCIGGHACVRRCYTFWRNWFYFQFSLEFALSKLLMVCNIYTGMYFFCVWIINLLNANFLLDSPLSPIIRLSDITINITAGVYYEADTAYLRHNPGFLGLRCLLVLCVVLGLPFLFSLTFI